MCGWGIAIALTTGNCTFIIPVYFVPVNQPSFLIRVSYENFSLRLYTEYCLPYAVRCSPYVTPCWPYPQRDSSEAFWVPPPQPRRAPCACRSSTWASPQDGGWSWTSPLPVAGPGTCWLSPACVWCRSSQVSQTRPCKRRLSSQPERGGGKRDTHNETELLWLTR